MKTLFVFLCGITIFFQSCCYTVDCQVDSVKIYLVSFVPNDTDTIILRRFTSNTNFQSLNDTVLLKNGNSLIDVVKADTSSLSIWDNASFKLSPGYDYEIFIPAVNSTTRISNISEQKSKHKECFVSDGQGPCYNPNLSFMQNSQMKGGPVSYIKK